MEKMIMIPEWRYNKMVESFDAAAKELMELRAQLIKIKEEKETGKN